MPINLLSSTATSAVDVFAVDSLGGVFCSFEELRYPREDDDAAPEAEGVVVGCEASEPLEDLASSSTIDVLSSSSWLTLLVDLSRCSSERASADLERLCLGCGNIELA
jgi:hypothetical protein